MALISLDPAATDWMLRAIFAVASPCCSIDAEMPAVISLHLGDGLGDAANRCDRIAGRGLHGRNLGGDLLGRLGGLVGERLDLGGDDAKPRPDSPARARLDGGVSASKLVCAAIDE